MEFQNEVEYQDEEAFEYAEQVALDLERLFDDLLKLLCLLLYRKRASNFASNPQVGIYLQDFAKKANLAMQRGWNSNYKFAQEAQTDQDFDFEPVVVPEMDFSAALEPYLETLEEVLKCAFAVSLGKGLTARQLQREIEYLLAHPQELQNRLIEQNVKFNKKTFVNPKGIYSVVLLNLKRLGRTWTAIAYRQSKHQRLQTTVEIVGYQIRISKNPNVCPMCRRLEGIYPKKFLFTGWHPQCRCRTIPIYRLSDNMSEIEMPQNFVEYINENIDKIRNSKSQPFYYTDNKKLVESLVI